MSNPKPDDSDLPSEAHDLETAEFFLALSKIETHNSDFPPDILGEYETD